MATTYTLQVDLDQTEFQALKSAGYSLCIAKQVANTYNVVWQGISFLPKNTFQWTEDYAVFGQDGFQSGAPISAVTTIQALALGQSIDLDANGAFQNTQGQPGGTSLTVNNNFQPINIGVQAKLNGTFAPIYLDLKPAAIGSETLTPVVSVIVWFDRTLGSSIMFTSIISSVFEVRYTGITSQTVSYVSDPNSGGGIWIYGDPTSGQGLQYAPHKLYHPPTGQFEDLPFADDHNIIRGLINKYLSSELGRSTSSPPQFLVQATVTLPPTGDPKEAVSFLKTYLPVGIEADFTIPTEKAYSPGKVIIAKLAWDKLVPMKSLTVGKTDIKKLETMFNQALKLYSPGYLSDTFLPLK